MKKKNILTLVLALALVAALAVGSTLAYFTSQDAEQNTFTMGNVKIDLQESQDEGKTWVDEGLSYSDVLPGNTENKAARVTVDADSADCYIMVTVKIADYANYDTTTGVGFNPNDITALYEAIQDEIAKNTKWAVTDTGDGLQCVYQESVAPGADVTLFEQIIIPTAFKNNVAGQSFSIDLNAYGIQSANQELADVAWGEAFDLSLPQA